ncbi:uncharacterized protein EI97DRAFT_385458 [Westerdykella ornata]|uniref:Endosomal peripheral membrane protein-like protein n=1 Tax=Westerdykella ornata TaxID=318751 RepID=A0A6A6J8P7_WESOR|nr:uncharacterized protein EI97DRAFT_385458 [Westerdykella ornata]KAF2272574.1 hypothetical protein EI97DRAFT_385458 [Westerdykella ornata]
MTAQILASELGNLIQDSKRKNSELRTAAEKALQDLKCLRVTSEAQLAAGHDIQLKILQSLPSLLQHYPTEIRGSPLSTVLQICSALQNVKNFAVSNTAAATLQQLVISVYERVVYEDERALEIPPTAEVSGDEGPIPVRSAAEDAYKVFNDLSLLANGENPVHIRFSTFPQTSTLELIEAILSNYGRVVKSHPEQIHILRSLLMPMIIRSLSERSAFPITLRIVRIFIVILGDHLSTMPSECEIALGLLNHMLDPEASPVWKRALCLEVFRGIYSDTRLVLSIYSRFDEKEGKRRIIGDNLAAFVRLATEKPAVIGLGQHSTAPLSSIEVKDSASEQAVAEAGALAGVIGGPVSESNANNHPIGISSQWSSLKVACIEHLDKTEPPVLPETYIYSLVLTCITNASETLAKFVLPLTVHHESRGKRKGKGDDASVSQSETASSGSIKRRLSRSHSFRKRTIPVNPLDLTVHPAYDNMQTTSALVGECWPAVLATCSTFLNATLDDEYYRALVRAIQKFTQVAGLMRQSTPRDAFLTTLGKAAVPANLLLANVSSPRHPVAENSGLFSNAKGLLSVDSLVSQASSISMDKNRRPSHEVSLPTLGPRNLMCLRALLNLAIALGPTLQSAWSIVLEALQVADLVMSISSSQSATRTPGLQGRSFADLAPEKIEAEAAAVQAAARRLFESSVDFPNESFLDILQALCSQLDTSSPSASGQRTPTTSARPQLLHQRRVGSVSGISLSTDTNSRNSAFTLNKIGELAALNEGRMAQYEPSESGWGIFVAALVRFCQDDRKQASARLLAAEILSRTVVDMSEHSTTEENRDHVQERILSALRTLISAVIQMEHDDAYGDTGNRIHQIALDALRNVIERCGDSLVAGWDSVLDSLLSVFNQHAPEDSKATYQANIGENELALASTKVITKSLARSAFASLQLVCSDFLSAVPEKSLSTILELLLKFCLQQEDLNMSLSTVTFFWNLSDFLQSRSDLSLIPDMLGSAKSHKEVTRVVKEHSQDGSTHALWLQILLNLSAVTADDRSELRNTAIHTIQRIFESHAEQLSPSSWTICMRTVPFAMVETNLAIHMAIRRQVRASPEEITAWNETTKNLLSSVSTLTVAYIDNVDDKEVLGAAWSDLLDYFREYFRCGSHALGYSVLTTITSVLSSARANDRLDFSALHKTARVWEEYVDQRDSPAWTSWCEGNQDAFLAYAEAFRSIYTISTTRLNSELPSMLSHLQKCVSDSEDVPYTSDIDHMTPLQSRVIESFSIIDCGSSEVREALIRTLSNFTTLPYVSSVERPAKRGPTFVALSKAAMNLLPAITGKHIKEQGIYPTDAFKIAMDSLCIPIEKKYVWQQEGKSPTLWEKATTTALDILGVGLENIRFNEREAEQTKKLWADTLYKIARRIIGVRDDVFDPLPWVERDEASDMKSFRSIREMLTEALGWSCVPDTTRRMYALDLFRTSLIHLPNPDEIENRKLSKTPLQGLYEIRFGQTKDLDMIPRMDIAYVCFSELLALVSAQGASPDRVRLAKAAAPYLILRAALPLRAYIADRPLRGRMPTPDFQQRELLFTLKALGELKSEPQAIPDVPGATSTYRKHLHRLYPLLLKALKVAKNDAKVFGELTSLMEKVGDEFGIEGDD